MNTTTINNSSGKVLVLGTDTRVVLAIARSLGRHKIAVHLGWLDRNSIARRSRYVTRVHELPAYHPTDTRWKTELLRFLDQERFDLVIPCNDSTLVPLQLNRQDFADAPGLHLHRQEVFDVVFDKLKSYELASRLGVAVPPAVLVKTRADQEPAGRLQFPVVVKPTTTFDGRSAECQSSVVVRADDRRALGEILAVPPYSHGCLVQEVFDGTGMGVEVLVDEGRILTAFQHQRLHETMEYGSSYRKSVPLLPELREAADKLMRALGYTGIGMVEFLYNLKDRRWIFVEINGRFWGSLPLAVNAGADFPYFLYQFWVENRREFPQGYPSEVYCRNLLLDWQGRKRRKPNGDSRLRGLCKDVAALVSLRDYLDSFSLDDPAPMVGELGQFARAAIGKLRAKVAGQPRHEPIMAAAK
ncbi:MAG: ATP-grasp domain-containing protein [Pirellulales bacterium]|nr:ATP-grasp domain-containing protein [Pirellulales bacterium]